MSRLAIFDIDGTLTDTCAVDDACFRRAVAEVFALEAARVDYASTPHVTDSAIVRYVCETHHGRVPDDAELQALIDRFVALLGGELAADRMRFSPIPGAVGLFPALRAVGWDVALATGGWGPSARLKLAASGLDDAEVALACASDALSREDIVQLARDRTVARTGRAYTRIVSVGDGVWDVRTAAALGLPFVGIATGPRAEALRGVGASTVLSDFADRAALFAALDAATVPAPVGAPARTA